MNDIISTAVARNEHRPSSNGTANCPRRRGLAVIFVLGLLAITLTVSYALLRTQVTSLVIANNLTRNLNARDAALAGLSAALHKIHEPDWEGVDIALSGRTSGTERFEVSFVTGDESLRPEHPDYAEYPYRLTLTSVGYAKDPANPQVSAQHRIRAVVQLVRRALRETPAVWSQLSQHTVYQWSTSDSRIQIPVQIEGSLLLNGRLRLCEEYPDDMAARVRYLADLENLRAAGQGDFRPLTGPIYLPYDRNDASTVALLSTALGVTTQHIQSSSPVPLTHPGFIERYCLYPGGKTYSVPVLQQIYGDSLSNITLSPDPKDNPLGVFVYWIPNQIATSPSRDLNLDGNVTIRGTLIGSRAKGELLIRGSNVHLKPLTLPPIYGSSETIQLPVAIIRDDLRVDAETQSSSVEGMVLVWDEFELKRASADMSFNMQGKLGVKKLLLHGRSSWDLGESRWRQLHNEFLMQLNDPSNRSPERFFPRWIEQRCQLRVKPLLTIKPESGAVTYHWHDWSQPLFVPHPHDRGLRWDLLTWQDEPSS